MKNFPRFVTLRKQVRIGFIYYTSVIPLNSTIANKKYEHSPTMKETQP